jgi:hypothetical protein
VLPLDHGLTRLAVTQLLVDREHSTTHQTQSSSPNRCAAAVGTCPASTHALQLDCIQGSCNRLPVAGSTVQQTHDAHLSWHVRASLAVRAATACLSQTGLSVHFWWRAPAPEQPATPCMLAPTHYSSSQDQAQVQLLVCTADRMLFLWGNSQ